MLTLIAILLAISLIGNAYMAYKFTSTKSAKKQAKVASLHSLVVKKLRTTIDLLTNENLGLKEAIVELGATSKAQAQTINQQHEDIARLTKAANITGSVSNGINAIGNALKQVNVANGGVALGTVAGNIVHDIKGIGRSFKQAVINAKDTFNKTAGIPEKTTHVDTPTT